MKRRSTLLIAFALVLGLTQCKKNVETIATPVNPAGEPVYITLNVGGGDKHEVYPNTGAVVYTDGDKIYVGNDGKYIGVLEYEDGAFSGTIYSPSTSDYLHFYFVGGLTPSTTPSAGSTTSFTVNIADQSSNLPVLSYGHSSSKYTDGTATYSCTLLNKCGLVKFTPGTATSATVTVGGMKTTATVDFATPGITPTATSGTITLKSEGDDAKWAILLPQDAVSNPAVTIEGYECTLTAVPEISNNAYITSGVNISMTRVLPYVDATFTVGSTTPGSGTSVKFSKGNLQYLGTGTSGGMTPKWRFADNQYDIMGDGSNGNVTIEGYSTYNYGSNNATPTTDDMKAARDLFGWGSSGGGSPVTPPYMTVNSTGSIYGGTSNISGTNCDWGVYNRTSIENHSNKSWRTLTSTEWGNLFNRTKTIGGSSKKLYGFATVMGIKGIVVLPDNWDGSVDGSFTYAGTDFTANQYTASSTVTWGTMEVAGAVFLPAAGYRYGSSVRYVGSHGGYWSSSIYSSYTDSAYRVSFYSGDFNATHYNLRCYGGSVRLVF